MLFELHKAIPPSLLITNYNKFLKHNILFDTGPLFLYIIGNFDNKNKTRLLSLFGYTLDDFNLLMKIIHLFRKSQCNFVITPYIFHELIKHIQDGCKKVYCDTNQCKKITEEVSKFIKPILEEIQEEKDMVKEDFMNHSHFLGKLEVGDISIDIVDKQRQVCSVIFTDDKHIKEEYEDNKNTQILVIHFTSIRNNAFLFPD